MTPVLGDFLSPARAHIIAAARSGGELPVPAKRGVIAELDRLVAVIARYLDDLALPDEFTVGSAMDHDVRAGLDARLAVRRAARSLRQAATAVQDATADSAHPAVRHLSSATGYLAAGRDLLQTHFTSGPAGAPIGSTHWAPVITSRPVTAALIAELTACSRQLAAWTAQLSRTGSLYAGLPTAASHGLRIASRWLRISAAGVQAAQLQQSPPATGYRLLAAIPPAMPPPRQPPCNIEPVADLCAGITVTAERLRHAAQAFACQARWSPAASSLSWRRDALASAITGHAGELIVRAIAERGRKLSASPAVCAELADAADAIGRAWPAWRTVARYWDTISTGIHHRQDISPVTAELEDLVLRTGRLAYHNPRWTPASADASPARDPADLAATAGDLPVVLAAVHHATDVISRVAACDAEAVRDAASSRRLYLPTCLLPEDYDIPCRYASLPPSQAAELLGAYEAVITASHSAAMALDDAAVTIDSPSTALAAGRTPSRSPATVRRPAEHDRPPAQGPPPDVPLPQAGQIEQILRRLHITEPGMLLRAAAIDDSARDVLAHASATSRKRDSINQQPPSPATKHAGRGAG